MTPAATPQSPNKLSGLGSPLLDVARQVGHGPSLIQGEEIDTLLFSAEINSSDFGVITVAQIEALHETYGAALKMEILHQDYILWNLDGVDSLNSFNEAKRNLADVPSVTLKFVLDKAALMSSRRPQQQRDELLFLFAERLCAYFSRPLAAIEKEVWRKGVFSKVTFLLCDEECVLRGPYLEIYGGSALDQYLENSLADDASAETSPPDEHERMTQLCRNHLRWQHSWVESLTPFHLTVAPVNSVGQSPTTQLSRVLATQSSLLSVLYTADSTFKGEERCLSVYQRGMTPIKIVWPDVLNFSASERSPVTLEGASQHLLSLVSWIYEPRWTTDRLLMAQSHIADELRARQSDFCFEALLDISEHLESDLRSRWKDFIEKKLDGYSEQQKKLEEDVAKTTQTFEEQIGSMTKTLGESGLTAAATAVVAIISAILKDVEKVNFKIPALCLAAYALYVFFFPCRLGLLLQQERFDATVDEFKSRRAQFEKRLDEEKVKRIIEGSQIAAVQGRFNQWADKSRRTYNVLIMGSLTAAAGLFLWSFFAAPVPPSDKTAPPVPPSTANPTMAVSTKPTMTKPTTSTSDKSATNLPAKR